MINRSNLKRHPVKRHHRTAICLVGVILLGLSEVSYAQSGATAIRDLPFSANEWITKTSTAPDGTVNVTTQQIAIARASDGTVRREMHDASAGSDHVIGRSILLVSILNQDTKTNSATFQGKPAVTAMDAFRLQNVSKPSAAKNPPAKPANSPVNPEMTNLYGLQAVVHRSQYTVPASGPNEKARTVTSELWYSPDLRMPLKSSISDPAGTTVVTVLDDIHRQEPDSSLFHVSTEPKTTRK